MKKSFGSVGLKSHGGSRGLFVMSAILLTAATNTALAGGGPLRPIAECMIRQGDRWLALWGYDNTTEDTIHQGVGLGNEFVPTPQDRGQPEVFFPGDHHCVLWTEQPADSSLTWRLCAPGASCNSGIAGPNTPACTDQFPPERVSSTLKGSLLIFSKVEIKWSADGETLLQDTFLDFSNDYPQNVDVQAYFINGDIPLREERDPDTGAITQTFEPGWNTADCRFKLTAGQPHYWSAATGSDKCQQFTVIDGQGPGRLDPETLGAQRILRGYVVMWAVKFDNERNLWAEIRWNHLKGDGVIVNFENGTAWEYNAWAFQSGCVGHGEFNGTPGVLLLNGVEYSKPFAELLLDFYGPGSEAFGGGGRTVQVLTDLTVHPVPVDLRQDNFGPVLTKVEAEVCNEFESCQSGTRRCVCCWDQTMLDVWSSNVPGAPNLFRSLTTDKGKALLRAASSTDCDFEDHCGLDDSREPIMIEEGDRLGIRGLGSGPTPILGLATKFLAFTGGGAAPTQATAGMNIVGAGGDPLNPNDPSAFILYDIQHGSDELRDDTNRNDVNRPGSASKPAVPSDRQTTLRTEVEPVPAE